MNTKIREGAAGTRASASLQPVERTTAEQTSTAHGGPHARAVGHCLEDLQPVESPHRSSLILKYCIPWEGPYAGAGEMCEEEGVPERNFYLLTTAFHSPSPVVAQGRARSAPFRRKAAEPGKRGECGWGKVLF